jgi:hypothetical protein
LGDDEYGFVSMNENPLLRRQYKTYLGLVEKVIENIGQPYALPSDNLYQRF